MFSEPAENEDKVGSATLELILSHQTSASEIISLAVERARRECTGNINCVILIFVVGLIFSL